MRSRDWQNFLEEQRVKHEKVLFTVAELANVAGVSGPALNVELTRLRKQQIITKYAHGHYGFPGAVTPQALVTAIDSNAYITSFYALYYHNLVTQAPVVITCFTDHRSPRARQRSTPLGRIDFICVRSKVYFPAAAGTIASPATAFCDYVYITRRLGACPENQVTFRDLARVRNDISPTLLDRYPLSVRRHVEKLLAE